METYSIYKITLCGKYYYYGISKDPKSRYSRHLRDLHNCCHHNIIMQRIWNKYKEINFQIINESLDKTTASNIEKYLIENEECINIAVGGEGGDTISNHPNNVTMRKRMSENHSRKFSQQWLEHQGKIYERADVLWGEYYCKKCTRTIKGKANFLRYHGQDGHKCGVKRDDIVCPHCGKIGTHPGPMKNKHFDKCKMKGK